MKLISYNTVDTAKIAKKKREPKYRRRLPSENQKAGAATAFDSSSLVISKNFVDVQKRKESENTPQGAKRPRLHNMRKRKRENAGLWCHTCGASFANEEAKIMHKREEHPEFVEKCAICGYKLGKTERTRLKHLESKRHQLGVKNKNKNKKVGSGLVFIAFLRLFLFFFLQAKITDETHQTLVQEELVDEIDPSLHFDDIISPPSPLSDEFSVAPVATLPPSDAPIVDSLPTCWLIYSKGHPIPPKPTFSPSNEALLDCFTIHMLTDAARAQLLYIVTHPSFAPATVSTTNHFFREEQRQSYPKLSIYQYTDPTLVALRNDTTTELETEVVSFVSIF
jgi:Zn ribbon nucleic-acid-binding protein